MHCVTLFSLLELFQTLWHSAIAFFLVHWIFQDIEKCQHGAQNPRHNLTKSRTPECFYSWRKCFSRPLHCLSLVYFSDPVVVFPVVFMHRNCMWSCENICSLFYFLLHISGSTSPLLFPFRSLCTSSFVSVWQSHYVCNWISVEPFRAGWLSY